MPLVSGSPVRNTRSLSWISPAAATGSGCLTVTGSSSNTAEKSVFSTALLKSLIPCVYLFVTITFSKNARIVSKSRRTISLSAMDPETCAQLFRTFTMSRTHCRSRVGRYANERMSYHDLSATRRSAARSKSSRLL